MRSKNIIERLRRNAKKQREFRHIVRRDIQFGDRKRIADIYFLANYANMSMGKIAKLFGISRERVRQIRNRVLSRKMRFTICHPKGSCL